MGTLYRSLFFTLALLWSSPSFSTPYFPDQYNDQIQGAVHKYWPDLPIWKLAKSQLYQESKLDPTVCSKVGACGLAQFVGPTWGDVINHLQWERGASRFDARLAIEGFAFYSAQLRGKWSPKGRSAFDRNDLQAASYNAGLGNVIKAQRACDNAVLWIKIAPCISSITGEDNAKQTRDYVTNIHKWFGMMQ